MTEPVTDYPRVLAEWGAQILEDELGVTAVDRASVHCDTGQYTYQPYSTWTGDFTGDMVVVTGRTGDGAERRYEYRDHTIPEMLDELVAVANGGRWDDPFKAYLAAHPRRS